MGRSLSREFAFKLLYSMEIQQDDNFDQIELYIQSNEIEDEKVKKYIYETIKGVYSNKD